MIDVKNLHKSFGNHEVLKGVNEHIEKGEKVVVIGPSGSGKTLLAQTLAKTLQVPFAGARLMLTPVSPACTRSSAMSASRTPFVVSATDSMPGTERISRTSSTTFRRMSGSPPVSRTLRTPSEASARTMRTISSKRRMSSCRSFSTPSSGMQ